MAAADHRRSVALERDVAHPDPSRPSARSGLSVGLSLLFRADDLRTGAGQLLALNFSTAFMVAPPAIRPEAGRSGDQEPKSSGRAGRGRSLEVERMKTSRSGGPGPAGRHRGSQAFGTVADHPASVWGRRHLNAPFYSWGQTSVNGQMRFRPGRRSGLWQCRAAWASGSCRWRCAGSGANTTSSGICHLAILPSKKPMI